MSKIGSLKTLFFLVAICAIIAIPITWFWTKQSNEVVDSGYSVQGTKILDNDGNEVILQGICVSFNDIYRKENSSDRADFYYQTYFKEEDVLDMKKQGATHIDFHNIWWAKLMTDDGKINNVYFENWLDYFVDYCERNKMSYILNIRVLGQSSLESGFYVAPKFVYEAMGYSQGWWDEEDANRIYADIIFKFYTSDDPKVEQVRQKWFETWRYVTNRYKDNRYCIGFALTNEPIHHTQKYRTSEISQEAGIGYSKQAKRCIDVIRSIGVKQLIFIDRPYLNSLRHIKPINRSNVVWEAHKYHSDGSPNIEEWKETIDGYINRFMFDFNKPLYIGEYGQDPIEFKNHLNTEEVIASITEQVSYLQLKSISGMSFFSWGRLSGRGWADWKDDWYTVEESKHILNAIFR